MAPFACVLFKDPQWPPAVESSIAVEDALLPSPEGLEGLERHLHAARQKLPRDNLCHSIAAQLPSPRGQFWKKNKKLSLSCGGETILGSAKTDPVRFIAFFEASKNPIPKRRKQEGPCLKRPLSWTGSVFPLPKFVRHLKRQFGWG